VDTLYDQLDCDGSDSGLHQCFCHVFLYRGRLRTDTERTVTYLDGLLMLFGWAIDAGGLVVVVSISSIMRRLLCEHMVIMAWQCARPIFPSRLISQLRFSLLVTVLECPNVHRPALFTHPASFWLHTHCCSCSGNWIILVASLAGRTEINSHLPLIELVVLYS